MRTPRTAAAFAVAICILAGSSGITFASSDDAEPSLHHVAGTLRVHERAPGGEFAVTEGIHNYRSFPVSASGLLFTDSRLNGELESTWNWNVHPSGVQPVPSWGVMRLGSADGAWAGDFSGIRRVDGGPVDIRASLAGEGLNEGLCSTLDILAMGTSTGDVWIVDGVVFPC